MPNFETALTDASPSIGGLQREAGRLKKASAIRHEQAGAALSVWKQESSEAKEHLKHFENHIDERIAHIEASISAIEDSLSKFRSAIIGREKAWHWSLDRASVIGLFVIAVLVAASRILRPEALNDAVALFGP